MKRKRIEHLNRFSLFILLKCCTHTKKYVKFGNEEHLWLAVAQIKRFLNEKVTSIASFRFGN